MAPERTTSEPPSNDRKPAWLLAIVCAVFVSALVFLEYAQRPVVNLMALAVPTLAALYVANRVEKRSDDQDAKLEDQTVKLKSIEKATNGDLTRRLEENNQPILDQLQLLHEALARNHPDDPLAKAAVDADIVYPDKV
jgi:hypothetical protein